MYLHTDSHTHTSTFDAVQTKRRIHKTYLHIYTCTYIHNYVYIYVLTYIYAYSHIYLQCHLAQEASKQNTITHLHIYIYT